jgi:hypothetical protein
LIQRPNLRPSRKIVKNSDISVKARIDPKLLKKVKKRVTLRMI